MQQHREEDRDLQQLERLSTRLRVAIVSAIIVSAIGIVSNAWEIEFIKALMGGRYADPDLAIALAEASDARQTVVGILQLLVHGVVWTQFLRWFYWSNRNIRALGADGLTFSPKRAVGQFFIPILNLWRPYMAVNELWKASHDPGRWRSSRQGAVLPLWWLICLVTVNFGQIAWRATLGAEGLEQLIHADTSILVVQVAVVALYYGMYMLVGEIDEAQHSNRRKILRLRLAASFE